MGIKAVLPKAETGAAFDVHADFIFLYDGSKIKCWERISEVSIPEDLQVGGHCKNLKDHGLEWQSKRIEKKDDKPVTIKLFNDIGIIVYKSGFILKFKIYSPSVSDEVNVFRDISFELLERYDHLVCLSPMNSATLGLSHEDSGDRN